MLIKVRVFWDQLKVVANQLDDRLNIHMPHMSVYELSYLPVPSDQTLVGQKISPQWNNNKFLTPYPWEEELNHRTKLWNTQRQDNSFSLSIPIVTTLSQGTIDMNYNGWSLYGV